MMHYFHTTLASAVADMPQHELLTLLANVAFQITDAFVKHHKDNEK